jgi:hypothetical protein
LIVAVLPTLSVAVMTYTFVRTVASVSVYDQSKPVAVTFRIVIRAGFSGTPFFSIATVLTPFWSVAEAREAIGDATKDETARPNGRLLYDGRGRSNTTRPCMAGAV